MSLKGQVRRYLRWFVAIIALMVIAVPTALYILEKQRFSWPWEDFYFVDAEFRNADATIAGQGQDVTIAGVEVGEVDGIRLENGLAVIRLRIQERYAPIYRNAEVLRRPRTALKDLEFMLDPGDPSAGALPDGGRLPSTQSKPTTTDEFLSTVFDADGRRGLQLLIAGLGGLEGKGPDLRRLFEAGQPTVELTRRLLRSIADRRRKLSRLVHNLNEISTETAKKDREISETVTTAARTFETLANEDAAVRESLRRLPGTVRATNVALAEGQKLSAELEPAARELSPVARALPRALRATAPLLRDATPILRDKIRPLVRDSRPVVRNLSAASRDLARAAPPLLGGTDEVGRLINELLYNPPGSEQPYLFYLGWFAHNAASVLSTDDAHGPVIRGQALFSCSTLQGIEGLSPILAGLYNLPLGACPTTGGGN